MLRMPSMLGNLKCVCIYSPTLPDVSMRRKGDDMIYQIKIAGALDRSWSDWLGNIKITSEKREDGSLITTLTVNSADQSTLFGILDRIRDLNIILISVTKGNQDI